MADDLILYIQKAAFEKLTDGLRKSLAETCKKFGYKLKIIQRWPHPTVTKTLEANTSSLMIVSTDDVPSIQKLTPSFPFHKIILLPNRNSKNDIELSEMPEALVSIRYLIGTNHPTFFSGLLSAILLFHSDTIKKSDRVTKHLTSGQQNKMSLSLNRSTQRAEMQKVVQDFFESLVKSTSPQSQASIASYPKNIADVLDEFLMNAIWDANPSREKRERSIPTQLDENEVVVIDCIGDNAYFTLSVQDTHGTFPSKALQGPIRYALGIKDAAKLNEGPGGAGLGLYMVLQKVSALIFEIEHGKATRAIAILRTNQTLKEMQREPRSILLFNKKI